MHKETHFLVPFLLFFYIGMPIQKTVFITDKYDSTISLSESLNHMIHHLNTESRNTLTPMLNNNKCKEFLLKASDLHLHFHDQAWKIWALLGVSPQTYYGLPHNINELLDRPSARTELKSLFEELFTIDRQVSCLLQECLSLL